MALLCMFSILLTVFIISQIIQPDPNNTLPNRIVLNRSLSFGALFAFFQGGAFYLFVYYLPIYFQAIKNASPIESGVHYLPLILTNVAGILLSGILRRPVGYYMPWIYVSGIFMSIGAGLLSTSQVNKSTGKWVGYQILFAWGSGFGFQQTYVAAQTILPLEDVSTGTACMLFSQLLGGAIFVSAAENVFTNSLVKRVSALDLQSIDPQVLVSLGATQLRRLVRDSDAIEQVLIAYNSALGKSFEVGLVVYCLSILGAVGMEWIPVQQKK